MEEYVKILNRILETAEKKGWFDKIINIFKHKTNILLLGTSGVNKTSIINSWT